MKKILEKIKQNKKIVAVIIGISSALLVYGIIKMEMFQKILIMFGII